MTDEYLREECEALVYDAFVDVVGRMPRIREGFREWLEPYAGDRYPLSKVGMFPRVTRRYMENWINVPKITKRLRQVKAIDVVMRELGLSPRESYSLVMDVMSRIGAESYTPEWNTISASIQLDDVISSWTEEMTKKSNVILAQTVRPKILSHFSGGGKRCLRIMDVGVGMGDTILPVMELMRVLAVEKKIPEDYLKYTRIFLVDVSRYALDATSARLEERIPGLEQLKNITEIGNVVRIPVNFADLHKNSILRSQEGNIDMIISGASICHQTDLLPFFRMANYLLRNDGILHAWDWYNGPTYAAPRLRLSRDGKRRTMHYFGAVRNDIEHILASADDHGISYDLNEGEFDCVPFQQSKHYDCRVEIGLEEGEAGIKKSIIDSLRESCVMDYAVQEIDEEDSRIVLANFRTLLGILGFVSRDPQSGYRCARNIGNTDVDTYLTNMYRLCITRGCGFSYIEDFLKKAIPCMDNPTPFEKSAYYLIEGYGDDYSRVMREAGFSSAQDFFFLDVYRQYKDTIQDLTDRIPSFQIRYTFGKK